MLNSIQEIKKQSKFADFLILQSLYNMRNFFMPFFIIALKLHKEATKESMNNKINIIIICMTN